MTTATTTCYRRVKGLIQTQKGWVICPKSYEGLRCQPGQECLDEQICHDPKIAYPDSSGFYLGLCTDATYKSPSCSPRCTDHAWGDVTYNSSTNLWACCGTNEACNKPTNETFLAPPPQQLLAAASSQSATTAPSTSTPSANVIGTSTPPAMIEQNPPLNEGPKTVASTSIPGASVTLTSTPSAIVAQSSLNEGAKAGIGVGAASVAVAIIALLAWVIMLRKRLRSPSQAQYSTGKQDASVTNEVLPEEAQRDTTHEHELSGHGWPYEMEGRHQI